jgi:hypothetical protein
MTDVQAKLGFDTSEAEQGINKAKGMFGGLGDMLGPISSKFDMLEMSVLGVSAAAVAAAGEIGKSLQQIEFQTGKTGEALGELNEQMHQIAPNATEGFDKIGDSLSLVTQRTKLTGKAAEELTDNLLKVGHALNGGEVHGLANDYTAIMNSWSVGAEGLDTLVKAAQTSGAPIASLMGTMNEFGATLRMMGYNYEHSTALMANFELQGVRTGRVMAAMNMGIQGESGDEAQFGKDLEKAQVMSQSGNKEGAINFLKKTMGFGARGMGDVFDAIKRGALDTTDMQAQIGNSKGAASGLIDKTLGADLERLKNQTTLALEPLGKELIKIAKDAVPVISSIEKMVAPLLKNDAAMNVAKLAVAFGLVNNAVIPVSVGIGKIITLTQQMQAGNFNKGLSGTFGNFVTAGQNISNARKGPQGLFNEADSRYQGAFSTNQFADSTIKSRLADEQGAAEKLKSAQATQLLAQENLIAARAEEKRTADVMRATLADGESTAAQRAEAVVINTAAAGNTRKAVAANESAEAAARNAGAHAELTTAQARAVLATQELTTEEAREILASREMAAQALATAEALNIQAGASGKAGIAALGAGAKGVAGGVGAAGAEVAGGGALAALGGPVGIGIMALMAVPAVIGGINAAMDHAIDAEAHHAQAAADAAGMVVEAHKSELDSLKTVGEAYDRLSTSTSKAGATQGDLTKVKGMLEGEMQKISSVLGIQIPQVGTLTEKWQALLASGTVKVTNDQATAEQLVRDAGIKQDRADIEKIERDRRNYLRFNKIGSAYNFPASTNIDGTIKAKTYEEAARQTLNGNTGYLSAQSKLAKDIADNQAAQLHKSVKDASGNPGDGQLGDDAQAVIEAHQHQSEDVAKYTSDWNIAAHNVNLERRKLQQALSAQEQLDIQKNSDMQQLSLDQLAAQQEKIATRDADYIKASKEANTSKAEQMKKDADAAYAKDKANLDATQAIAKADLEARYELQKKILDEQERYNAGVRAIALESTQAAANKSVGGNDLRNLGIQAGYANSASESVRYADMIGTKQDELDWDRRIEADKLAGMANVNNKWIRDEERKTRQAVLDQQLINDNAGKAQAMSNDATQSFINERIAQNAERIAGLKNDSKMSGLQFGFSQEELQGQRALIEQQYAFAGDAAQKLRLANSEQDIDSAAVRDTAIRAAQDKANADSQAAILRNDGDELRRIEARKTAAINAANHVYNTEKQHRDELLESQLEAIAIATDKRMATHSDEDMAQADRSRSLSDKNFYAQGQAGLLDSIWGTKTFGLNEQKAELPGNRADELERLKTKFDQQMADLDNTETDKTSAKYEREYKAIFDPYQSAIKDIESKYQRQTWQIDLDIKKDSLDKTRDFYVNLFSNLQGYRGTEWSKGATTALRSQGLTQNALMGGGGYDGSRYYNGPSIPLQGMSSPLVGMTQPVSTSTAAAEKQPIVIQISLTDGLEGKVVNKSLAAVVDMLNDLSRR